MQVVVEKRMRKTVRKKDLGFAPQPSPAPTNIENIDLICIRMGVKPIVTISLSVRLRQLR
jgi:hypothetical protein